MDRFSEWVKDAGSIAVAGHLRPDGDSVGACLATALYLLAQDPGRRVCVLLEEVQEKYRFLPGTDLIRDPRHEKKALYQDGKPCVFDLFIALDCGAADRLDHALPIFQAARRTLCIDHHQTNDGFASENEIQAETSSTCEILFDSMDPALIDRDIATCLYLGIAHDTGVFQFSCTTPKTLRAAAQLVEKGVPFNEILDRTYCARSFLQTRVLGLLLERVERFDEDRVALAWIGRTELDALEVPNAALEVVVPELRRIEGCDAAVFLYEINPGFWRVSMRGNTDAIDLASIANRHGGGGHRRAAGCNIKGEVSAICEQLLSEIARSREEQDQAWQPLLDK